MGVIFSSSKPKAALVFVGVVVTFNIFLFVYRTTGSILTKHGINHPWPKGIQDFSNKEPQPFQKADNNEIAKIHQQKFENLLQNQLDNFNNTAHKEYLGEGNYVLVI